MSTSTPFKLQDDYASILLPKKKTSIYDSLFTPSTTRYNKLTFMIMTRRQRAAHPHSPTSPNNDTNETSSHTSQHNLQNPMATAPPPPQEAQETEPLNSPPNNISEQDHQPLPPLQTTTASRPILPPVPPSSNPPLPRVDVISIPFTPPSEITPGLPTPSNTPSNTSLPQRRTIPPLEVPPYYPTLDPTAPSTNIARLAQRPKNFSGTGLKRSQDETKTWLGKMECWLTCIGTPSKDWATIATTYLDPPAFNVVQANVKTLQAAGTWQNTFQQFSDILLKNYGDVDADFAVRTRLARLRLQYSQDIVKYSKIFHELSTRITGEPLSDQAKISAFLTGIQDPKLFAELVIEPHTGQKWSSYDKLHDYVLSKYSFLQLHTRNETPPAQRFPKPPFPSKKRFLPQTTPLHNTRFHTTPKRTRRLDKPFPRQPRLPTRPNQPPNQMRRDGPPPPRFTPRPFPTRQDNRPRGPPQTSTQQPSFPPRPPPQFNAMNTGRRHIPIQKPRINKNKTSTRTPTFNYQ